jgi:hypothetical protein
LSMHRALKFETEVIHDCTIYVCDKR